jgi:AraC-like DNA-binding protein
MRSSSPSKTITRFGVTDADADQLREHYARTLTPVDLNPVDKSGTISVEDLHFTVGDFSIWSGSCRSGMEVRFSEPPDALVIYLPLKGAMELGTRGERLVSTPNTLIVSDLCNASDLRLHPERSHIGIAFPRQVVTRQLSELLDRPIVHDVDFSLEIDMASAPGRTISGMGKLLWDLIADEGDILPAHTTEQMFRTILVALLELLPHHYASSLAVPESPALPRHLKRAIDFMSAHIAEPLDIEDIAKEAGVSIRALQGAFQQFKGTTPRKFLQELRLEGVRRDIMAAKDRLMISDIAKKWGFTHMGRFSLLYRDAFGEMPSQSQQGRRIIV